MTTARTGLADIISVLPPVSLDEVVARADLQTRVDRKYLVPLVVFERLMTAMGDRLTALDVDGLRVFDYESIYFDTLDLVAYRAHVHGRRRRFKVRTRAYLDSGECVLEVKTEGGRGETVKQRMPYSMEERHGLTLSARAFAMDLIGDPVAVPALTEVVTTAYARSTLLDRTGASRMTCDVDMSFVNGQRQRQGPRDTVLIESKTVGAATEIDGALWQLGQRPLSISKYCVGMALLRPELPANRWNRELRTHFGWEPRRPGRGATSGGSPA
jgi:hypothetical protein